MWIPKLEDGSKPRYEAIARAIARDVDAGALQAGERLPTHRALAIQLGVAIPTVTRAYALAEQWGVVSGEVGRGTFVRGRRSESARLDEARRPGSALIDLASTNPPPLRGIESRALAQAFQSLAARADLSVLMRGPTVVGPSPAHECFARWLYTVGLEEAPERIVLSVGPQQALFSVLMATCKPGDSVLCESVTYPGMRSAADALRIRLVPLAMDEHGLLPGALEEAAKRHQPRVLYTVPTVHAVTCALMPESRRRAVAQIAQRRDLLIVEDDEYSFVLPHAPAPLASHAPDHSFFIADFNKVITPGVRVGLVHAPQAFVGRLVDSVRTCVWTVPPPMVELASMWIESGTALSLVAQRQTEIEYRQALLARVLGGLQWRSPPGAHQAWVDLPPRIRAERIREQARRAGVLVGTPESARVGRAAPPNGVIVALGGEGDRTRFEKGLSIIADLLRHAHRSTPD